MITVVGSLNMDLVTTVDRFPKKGETLQGNSFATIFGGKGANQAVAAARFKREVHMIGRVGDDAFGQEYRQYLTEEGILIENVKPVTHEVTGTALITVAEQDNTIVIVAGANDRMTADEVEATREVIERSNVLLVQLEIPLPGVERAIQIAKEAGTTVILNPAPYQELPDHWWELIDYVTPNEHEAAEMRQSSIFKPSYEEKLIITEGSKGASYFTKGERKLVSAPKVEVKDTTGAGDTFNGVLAAGLDEGLSLETAVAHAVAAASLSVTAFGAQTGMPTNEQLQSFLEGGKSS
ncbi:ribokinase [Mesobacillus persicus]|uniref:Ribokinase n=1 Tax=Mesobacillus persicus TaxID=930146 RepID=A0A1H8G5A8_9BACI|nr:ribokinase [Mesobacillus persicus]SEN38950.1 ribokinase [Mesobacillus persicus]